MFRGTRSSVFLGLLLISSGAGAAGTFEERARGVTEEVRDEVQRLAERLDLALAGKQYTKSTNDTRINLSQLVSYTEGGRVVKSTDLGVSLKLPNTETRWQARFATYDEEQESRDMQQRRVRTTPRARDPGASLFFLRKLGDIRTTFQPKLQLKNPLEMSYVLKLESETHFRPVRVTPQLQLFTDAVNGTGEYFAMSFSWRILERTDFTFDNDEEYHERDHNFSTHHGLVIDHALTDTKAVGCSLITQSLNHPQFHLDTLTFSTSYAQEIYRDLLKYVVSPFIGFAKVDHFKGKVGGAFTLTLYF